MLIGGPPRRYDIQPSVLYEGDDFGKWLQQQKQPGT